MKSTKHHPAGSKIASMLLIAALLTGCASLAWVKPGGSVDDLNRDAGACQREAQRQFPAQTTVAGATDEPEKLRDSLHRREQSSESCMKALGYTRQRRYGLAW